MARPNRSALLGEVLRRCEATPCTGLRVVAPGVPRIAVAWLEEAANVGGGLVWQPDGQEIWLLGAAHAPSRRALDLLRGMGWAADLLDFPRELAALEAAMGAEPTMAPSSPPGAAGLEERAARLPPEAGHALATLWRMGAAGPLLLAQRWMPDPAALPVPPDADWCGYANTLLAGRLLTRAGRAEWPAQHKPNLPLLLDMPWIPPPATLPAPPGTGHGVAQAGPGHGVAQAGPGHGVAQAGPGHGVVPAGPGHGVAPAETSHGVSPGTGHALVLPMASLPDVVAWQAAAAAAGWGLAWSGLTPLQAHLLDSLPGGFVFAQPGEYHGWPASPRLVLSGLDGHAALGRAVAGGYAVATPLGE